MAVWIHKKLLKNIMICIFVQKIAKVSLHIRQVLMVFRQAL